MLVMWVFVIILFSIYLEEGGNQHFHHLNYRYDPRKSVMEWSIVLIDNSNRRLIALATLFHPNFIQLPLLSFVILNLF